MHGHKHVLEMSPCQELEDTEGADALYIGHQHFFEWCLLFRTLTRLFAYQGN